jgi:hypothetical protein
VASELLRRSWRNLRRLPLRDSRLNTGAKRWNW